MVRGCRQSVHVVVVASEVETVWKGEGEGSWGQRTLKITSTEC